MTSKIVVNNIEADAGVSTVTFGSKISSSEFVGPVVGNVTGNVTGNVVIGAGSTSAPSLSPSGDSNTGIFFPSADTIAFAEGGVEALRIDSNGNLQLTAATNGSNQSIQFGDPDASNRGLLQYRHGDDSLRVYVAASEKLHITSGGNVQIANGNLVFSTSGTGIDFSATSDGSGTTTSELLDEYEEGTWTPVFKGAGTAGSYTLSVTEAQYTRIGRMVHLYCQFSISSIGSAGSAYAVIEGMPFDVGSQTLGSCSLSGVDIATAGTHYHVTRVSGVSDHRLYFFVSQDNASPYDIQVSEFSSGDSVMVTMMYTAA